MDQRYEAKALLKIGRIGEISKQPYDKNAAGESSQIENTEDVLFKIKSLGFATDLNRRLGFEATVNAEKAGTMVLLSARAKTRNEALAALSASVGLLKESHDARTNEFILILERERVS